MRNSFKQTTIFILVASLTALPMAARQKRALTEKKEADAKRVEQCWSEQQKEKGFICPGEIWPVIRWRDEWQIGLK